MNSASRAPVKYYRPELDWLRFMAFSAVFVHHAFPKVEESYSALGMPSILAQVIAPLARSGAYGVDLFFALSAFLITELLLLERERTGRIHILSFYVRRVLRIWPLYYAFILAVCPFEILLRGNPVSYYAMLLTFTGNLYGEFGDPYFLSVCLALWSVCIEEQFYIVWPNLMARLKPARFGMALVAIMAFTCVCRAFYVYGVPPTPGTVWSNTLTRLDPFALGGLLALVLHNRNWILPGIARGCALLAGIGVFWFLGTFPFAGQFFEFPVWSYPAAAVASVLCILAFVSAPPRPAYSRPLRVLSYLGKISYGLYVFHCGAIAFSEHILPDDGLDAWLWVSRALIAGVLTLSAAMVSYARLEKPFLMMKRRYSFIESRPA
ncbi:MAG: acyltransferase [Candidatus Hydrogenedentales bacterium]